MDSKKELKKGLFYSFAGKYSNIIISIFVTSILARILSPKEFGIVTIINVFLVFFNNLADMGFGASIVQKKEIDNKFISSIFLFITILGFFLSIIFYLFSKFFIVNYYNNEVYNNLGFLVAINLFLSSLGVVPKALMNRYKLFKEIGMINLISNILSGVLAIILAFLNFSYYAIIFQGLFLNLFLNILIVWKIKFKFSFYFKIKHIKEIFGYSSYLFIFNFINYFARNLDNILIGKYMGMTNLGFYDKAYKLMLFPLTALTSIVNSVLHPIFARYQDNKEKIYIEYLGIIKLLSFLGVWISNVAFFSAEEIILILYGKNWLEIVPIFKILSFSIFIQIVLSTTGAIFLALGRSDKMFSSGLFYSGGLITSIILGIYRNNLRELTFFLVIAFIFGYIVIYRKMLKIFKKNFYFFLYEFKYSYFLGIILIIVNLTYRKYIVIENIYFSFIVKNIFNFGIAFYFIKRFYFKNQSIKEIINIIKK